MAPHQSNTCKWHTPFRLRGSSKQKKSHHSFALLIRLTLDMIRCVIKTKYCMCKILLSIQEAAITLICTASFPVACHVALLQPLYGSDNSAPALSISFVSLSHLAQSADRWQVVARSQQMCHLQAWTALIILHYILLSFRIIFD